DSTALLIGIPRRDAVSNQYFNSVVALGSEGRSVYDKRHLVPFGEYFPVPEIVRGWMRLMNLPYSDFAAGASDEAVVELAGEQLAVTICYEDVFGAEQLDAARQASLLVNVSNDAWFGDSIAPHQHLQIARMRAMETRRPMLRATNTGISAVIDAHGRLVAISRQFEPEILRAEVAGHRGNTPYMRTGDWLSVLLSLLAITPAIIVARRPAI
ncbi:MAG: apolipoprotein N-acyltransferase, partial [Gammaproteobacteria bacterium]|nr:apolipoprotein N-acyltransferase [Gammaproteobacteria bacterium]